MDSSSDTNRASLQLFLYLSNNSTTRKSLERYQIRLDRSLVSETRVRNMLAAPKLLLAIAICHGLVTSGYISPTPPGIEDETSSLLKKGETDELWSKRTDMVSLDNPPSEVGFPDANSTGKLQSCKLVCCSISLTHISNVSTISPGTARKMGLDGR